ncbi:hypothetical protein MSHOH_2878 [Methanosarcina horonobensis HB-1 = JCM 15518]|uniref:Proteinase inhibitor I42 chagasin domain-containing protein n=2 Tax=Methanosarcina horonobensis TaxID=418008 RepID=A0A0E3SEJ2_9EURY|nr:hypothetical protein MSHOH_2878 [Methanosarcina horonobensis HB-1 = JCM 15518]
MNAKVGDIIEVSLPSNPVSTGYSCLLSEMPGCVYFIESTYTPDKQIIPGKWGTSRFKFVAIKKGKGRFVFRNVRFSHPLKIEEPTIMQERFIIVD